jgi:alpha-glucosidase (family GH31 glycosyl hydrolase)
VRLSDRLSIWEGVGGLAATLSSALMLGLSGWPFVLPDMVGGNAYGEAVPDKELYIRWFQACAPLFAMQLSIAPWDYDVETVSICRRYADLHMALAPLRMAAAAQAVQDGSPVVRPVFWAAPRIAEAQLIADQFLLGDTLLAAPVIAPGARQRDIYLPPGTWRDYWSGAQYAGGWLRAFPAPLDTLPLFTREG